MNKYNFRLQKVLKIRQLQQDIEEQKLAASKQQLQEEQTHLAEVQERERKFLDELKQKRLMTIQGHEFHKYTSYQRQVEKYVEQQNQNVLTATEAVEIQRTNLIEAAQETSMIDKLEERAYEKFLRRKDSAEQKIIDELSQLKPFRKAD
ncbi:MAG TPA: flagellar export protein FliJ [bacterium]|nr:flagellar export protein FliJ [bacterium]